MITFADFFAGIGGFHIGMSNAGAKCVFACEIDKPAAETYELNHGIKPVGDIMAVSPEQIPDFDIFCGGFPCQGRGPHACTAEVLPASLTFDIARGKELSGATEKH